MIKLHYEFIASTLRCALFASALLCFGGCAEFFAHKPVELQSRKILSDLSRIKIIPDPNITIPDVYKDPPKVVEQVVDGRTEMKLFYFCRYHTSDHLAEIVDEQFGRTLFDEEGKSTIVPNYTVTSNPATNQLIVRCPTAKDIDAVQEFLQEVDIPPIQVRIDCIISEIYADNTLDWETTLEIKDLFGEGITLGGKTTSAGELLPAFPGAALRDVGRSKFGLKVGYASTSHDFQALIDLLQSRGYLKILMNPSLEVINGQTAKIVSSEHVPLQTITVRSTQSDYMETTTEYIDVIDSLEITPHVFADGYIGLETTITLGSKAIPEGVKQIPIVTKREISNKENRIRHGESLIIGGIRKSEERAVVRGIPVLKDIPLIGVLFSSKDFEERATETLFIITPTISTGGIPNEDVVEQLRRKHSSPLSPEVLREEVFLDPLGIEAHKRSLKEKARQADDALVKSEAQKSEALHRARQAGQQADLARAEAEAARTEARQAAIEAAELKRLIEELNKKLAKTPVNSQEKNAGGTRESDAEADKVKAEDEKNQD
jgi:hypothetical protein